MRTIFKLMAVVTLVGMGALFAIADGRSTQLSDCSQALYRGDYARAEQLAAMRLQRVPSDVEALVLLGRAQLAEGKLRPAFDTLVKARVTDPRNIDALYYLSFAARALSDEEYQRLLATAPDSARVHQLLAETALQAQDPGQAETEFLKALEINPRSLEVNTDIAELKRSQSKFDEAITYYQQAAQIGPLNYEISYGLGACYTYKADYAKAIEWLRKAAAFSPGSVAAHFALGNALFQQGNMEPAVPELKETVRLEPHMKQAYFLLGRAYAKMGRNGQADAAFKKLDELNTSAPPSQGESPKQNQREEPQ
jgi:tetratricopeptide (TPR) repeat protein